MLGQVGRLSPTGGADLSQERADLGVEARNVDEEGVVPFERGQGSEPHRRTPGPERFRYRRLLGDRKQEVALDANDQHSLGPHLAQGGAEAAAMLTEIEAVHGTG